MDTLHEIMRWTHIGVGTMAFASLWTAGFTRKGGRAHRAAGVVYVWTMTIVLLTAFGLTALAASRGQWIGDHDLAVARAGDYRVCRCRAGREALRRSRRAFAVTSVPPALCARLRGRAGCRRLWENLRSHRRG